MATVLIAPPEHLPVLQARPGLHESIAFADADVLKALETITTLRPAVVALEKTFADTSRGSALIERIKADPSLQDCEVRLVLHDDTEAFVPQPPPAAVTNPPISPLDYRGTRKAERFNVKSGLEIQLEGNPVQLVNISTAGVQILSPTIVRPNQRVRLALTAQPGATRFKSIVAWSSFELPLGVPRYRAGIEILEDTDAASLHKFIKKHKA